MPIDLRLPEISELVTRKFKIPDNISKEFDLYVSAAQEDNPNIDDSLVLQAIIEKQLKKDRAFRAWLKKKEGKTNNKPIPTEKQSTAADLKKGDLNVGN